MRKEQRLQVILAVLLIFLGYILQQWSEGLVFRGSVALPYLCAAGLVYFCAGLIVGLPYLRPARRPRLQIPYLLLAALLLAFPVLNLCGYLPERMFRAVYGLQFLGIRLFYPLHYASGFLSGILLLRGLFPPLAAKRAGAADMPLKR